MISDESCDAEDWVNDAENSALSLQEYISDFWFATIVSRCQSFV